MRIGQFAKAGVDAIGQRALDNDSLHRLGAGVDFSPGCCGQLEMDVFIAHMAQLVERELLREDRECFLSSQDYARSKGGHRLLGHSSCNGAAFECNSVQHARQMPFCTLFPNLSVKFHAYGRSNPSVILALRRDRYNEAASQRKCNVSG